MAVIITKQNCNLNTANAFYLVEDHNLSGFPLTATVAGTGLALTSARAIPLTFSTGGVFKGVVISLWSYSTTTVWASNDRIVTVNLQEDVAGTWTTRSTKTMTWGEINMLTEAGVADSYHSNGMYTVNFTDFDTPITVDTAANKWRLRVLQSGGTRGTIYLALGANSSTPMYAVYCDNLRTFADNDTPIFAHYCEITATCTFGEVLGVGETVVSVCGIVCSNISDISVANVCYLTILTPPAAITVNIKGRFIVNDNAGIRVGTSLLPIPIARPVTFISATPALGTSTVSGFSSYIGASTTYYYTARPRYFFYAETVTHLQAKLTANANTGQPDVVVDKALTGDWAAGDIVSVGKQDVAGQGVTTIHTISSITGNTITLTTNLATNNRLAGGYIINLSNRRHSIRFNTATTRQFYFGVMVSQSILVFKNCWFYRTYIAGLVSQHYYANTNTNAKLKSSIENCIAYTDTTAPVYLMIAAPVNYLGLEMINCGFFRTTFINTISTYKNTLFKSGDIFIKNIYQNSSVSSIALASTLATYIYCENIFLHNRTSGYAMYNYSKGGYFKNIEMWGSSNTSGSIALNAVNSTMEQFKIDKSGYGIVFITTNYNNKFIDFNIGQEIATDIADIFFTIGSFNRDQLFENLLYNTFDEASFAEAEEGSLIRFTEIDSISNNDGIRTIFGRIRRTGDSLPDTTVRTSGAGKFALRINSLEGGSDMCWDCFVPTGNIQNKTMSISCWIKINSADYYAGSSYNLPTLKVIYDTTSQVSMIAQPTTDWQLLTVSFTPLTTYGQVQMVICGNSDASVESNRYFYVDDISVFYPPGVALNLGGLDLWADGLPITPPIATSVNANDVWAVLPATFNSGSVGAMVVKIDKTGDANQGLIIAGL